MARIKIGKVRPVNKGAYDSSLVYEAYDYVLLNGSAWLALKLVPAGFVPGENPDYWVLFGAKGEKGEQGKQGIQGEKGESAEMPEIGSAAIDNLF